MYELHNFTQKEIGKKFNINQSHVWRIVNHTRWKHIPDQIKI